MSIDSEKDLIGLMAIGRVVGLTLRYMQDAVRPGMSTGELDGLGEKFMKQHGARSAPRLTYNYPGGTCISINDEAAHGIPGSRVIQPGDLVNIDVSAELDGFYADTGASMLVPPGTPEKQRLCNFGKTALEVAINTARAGQPIHAIGRAVEAHARKGGYNIIEDLPGHGVGRKLHEPPTVPNFFHPKFNQRLTEGLVITLEPFLSTRARRVVPQADGWTLKTPDGSLVVQYEHTVVITKGRPVLVTAV